MGTQRKYTKAQKISLSCALFFRLGDEIGRHVLFRVAAPDEYYEKRVTSEQLHAAMSALPEKQHRRIYAHYILKIPPSEIARLDGVDHRTVNISIQRGLRNLERYLKNIF